MFDFDRPRTWIVGIVAIILIFIICACTIPGCKRIGSSMWAGAAGADWIVVQYGYDGTPINAWTLNGVSVSNEAQSDGVYWKNEDGHLVHIAGWYNRVQVSGQQFEEAAKLLGVELDRIKNGRYVAQ